MTVRVQIKHNKKDITIYDIADLKGLCYGVSDNNYCLDYGEVGQYTILYNENYIGRGIEVYLEEDIIDLNLPLPTSSYEIEIFYSLIVSLCKELNVSFFTRDDALESVDYAYSYIEADKEACLDAIKDLDEKIRNKEVDQMIILGAYNPISLGINEMDEIGGTLEGFDQFLNRLQHIDAYYANPVFYQRQDKTIFGLYFVGEDIPTIVPTVPYSLLNNVENIDSWYVRIPDSNDISYDEFINHIDEATYYDNNHLIVSLNEKVITKLIDYSVNITTKELVKGSYFGKVIDDGRGHLSKIRNMKLDTEELSAFNHLTVFLRWAYEHNMLSEKLLDEVEQLSELIEDKTFDLREVFTSIDAFNYELKTLHFNEVGQEFVGEFYVFNTGDGFPACVDKYAEKVLGSEKYHCEEYKDEAYLFVPFNEDYYQGLSKYIDDKFEKFLKHKEDKYGGF